MKPLADCRLYAFVDSAYLNGRSPAELAQLLVDGGADILQRHGLREDPRLAGCAEGRRLRGQGAVQRAAVPNVLVRIIT